MSFTRADELASIFRIWIQKRHGNYSDTDFTDNKREETIRESGSGETHKLSMKSKINDMINLYYVQPIYNSRETCVAVVSTSI